MEEFNLSFKDDTERIVVVLMLVLSIFGSFIPAILVVLCFPTILSENSLKFAKELFNFELSLFVLGAILTIVSFGLGGALIGLVNLIILLMGLVSISNNTPVKLIKTIKIL